MGESSSKEEYKLKKNTLARTMRLAQLAMLIAIQAILTFTPLGFIMIPPISITIMHIPVIIGADDDGAVVRPGFWVLPLA